MGAALGDVLPLAFGVAVSPVPIIAVILMLLAPRAGGTSTGFLAGWLLGIVVATVLFWCLAALSGLGSADGPSTAASWLKLLLGLVLLALGARQWRSRPKPGEQAALPKWMAAIDSFNPVKALALGFVLAAVNPKNLTLCVAAGTALGGLAFGDALPVAVVFMVLAASTVAVPVIAYALAAERMRTPLDELKSWLQANNGTVMTVLLGAMGVVLLGKGLGGLL